MRINYLSLLLCLALVFYTGHSQSTVAAQSNDAAEILDIENPTTADFMARSYSVFEAGSPSFLDDTRFQSLRSSALERGYRNDQPNVKVISFDAPTATKARVRMFTDAAFHDCVLDDIVLLQNGHGQYTLQNFVPGLTYYYQVIADGLTLTSGQIKATGQLRMIHCGSSWNIRDLGGWTGWGGNTVRYEWIYRGGSLGGQNPRHVIYHLTAADLAELHRIGIRAHLDLRGLPGKGAWPNDDLLNAYTLGYTPLSDAHFMNIATDFALYDPTTCSAIVGDVAWIIHQLRQGRPVYFHCRTGADRTGTIGYTLLALLGCDNYKTQGGGNQIALDYELTSLGMDEQGTIAYNTYGKHTGHYSNRYANTIASMPYAFFRTIHSLQVRGISLTTLQDKIYYYLNRYFLDNDVETAGRVSINKADLDWFVNFMLGITDRQGNLLPSHTTRYTGPTWAINNADRTLQHAFTTAYRKQYKD
ncbi:MAG: tyrosine-protein phosphatase [Bacteroidaceae bacterium]|nr:tyrosine-protein phosphatase [Bacteroidaceae bacterium]